MNYIFTTVYPGSKRYFKEFIESVNSQTSKDFKLFIILNGTKLSKTYMNLIKTKFLIFEINETWQKARLEGLNFLLKKKAKLVIFADSDDILDKFRVEYILKKIKGNDFIVNNLFLFGKNINKKQVWLKIK